MELKNAGSCQGIGFCLLTVTESWFTAMPRCIWSGRDTLDIVVERDGQTVRLDGLYLPRQERTDEEGVTTNRRGILVASEAAPLSGFGKVQYAWNMSLDFVRLVWISLGDLISGSVGVRDLSGPVGIVDTMTEVGSSATSAYAAFYSLTYFARSESTRLNSSHSH